MWRLNTAEHESSAMSCCFTARAHRQIALNIMQEIAFVIIIDIFMIYYIYYC